MRGIRNHFLFLLSATEASRFAIASFSFFLLCTIGRTTAQTTSPIPSIMTITSTYLGTLSPKNRLFFCPSYFDVILTDFCPSYEEFLRSITERLFAESPAFTLTFEKTTGLSEISAAPDAFTVMEEDSIWILSFPESEPFAFITVFAPVVIDCALIAISPEVLTVILQLEKETRWKSETMPIPELVILYVPPSIERESVVSAELQKKPFSPMRVSVPFPLKTTFASRKIAAYFASNTLSPLMTTVAPSGIFKP